MVSYVPVMVESGITESNFILVVCSGVDDHCSRNNMYRYPQLGYLQSRHVLYK